MDKLEMKRQAAKAAIDYININDDSIIGIGSGSTVVSFIEQLEPFKNKIKATVAASIHSEQLLKKIGIEVLTANDVSSLDVYIDGADEVNSSKMMIKGGGAALTREKIVSALAKKFVCIIDQSKQVDILGSTFPLPIEVIPVARSYVARKIVQLGGIPRYREGVITDNGNVILDIHNFKIMEPLKMEMELNNIAGVVTNGIFAMRSADVVIVATDSGVKVIEE